MNLKHAVFLCCWYLLVLAVSAKEVLYKTHVQVGKNEIQGSEISKEKINYHPREENWQDSGREEPEPVLDDDPKGKENTIENEKLKSLEYYFHIKSNLEERDYEWTLYYATTLRKIGLSYQRLGEFSKALDFYNYSQVVFRQIKYYESEYHKVLYYNFYSLYRKDLQKPCKAAYWLQKANLLETLTTRQTENLENIKKMQNQCSGKEG
ncbi:MAG: hypothetical protein AAF518_17445 [Spirochaetota bacterium]